jgi:outer membrane protein OmpA-like peptidoglycan-associated protein
MNAYRFTLYSALLATLALPARATGQPEQLKSTEEIVDGLLGNGGSRGAKGLRADGRPSIAIPIQFEYNSATITPESFQQLQLIAEALKNRDLGSQRVLVEGHTDNLGSDAFNQQLSERRAEAVKRYLVEKLTIDSSRLETKGVGKSRPLDDVSQQTEEGRALNRRVVFVNLGQAGAEAAASDTGGGDLNLEVVVRYEKGGQTGVLAPGDVLTPADNYRVTFTANRDGYVYIYQVDATGKVDPIFPNQSYTPAANPVVSRRPYAIPPEGQWLSLDETQGREEIIVVASKTQLSDPKAIALDLGEGSMRGGIQEVASVTRGVKPVSRPGAAVSRPAGLFAYRLPFEHR